MRKLLIPLLILCLLSCQEKLGHQGSDEGADIYLDKPSGLVQVDQGENSVKLSWSPVENAKEYQYRLSEVVDVPEKASRVLVRGATEGTYKTIWGLDPNFKKKGISYWFSVSAVNGKSTSGFCDSIRVEPTGIPPIKLIFNASADDFLIFKAGSCVSLYDGISDAVYEVITDGPTTTLEVVSEYCPEPDATYFATIPEVIDGTALPASYVFADNVFDNLPMWASSTTTNLYFKTYLGILALRITKDEAATLNELTLTAQSDIAGVVSSHTDGEQPSVVAEGSSSIAFSFGTGGLEIDSSGQTVFIPVPAGIYASLEVSAVFGEEDPALVELTNISIASGEKTVARAAYTREPAEPSPIEASDIDNDNYYNNAFGDEN